MYFYGMRIAQWMFVFSIVLALIFLVWQQCQIASLNQKLDDCQPSQNTGEL